MLLDDEPTFYRLLAELTSDYGYAYRVGPDGGMALEWMSDAVARVTGYAVEDIAAAGWGQIIHPDDFAYTQGVTARLLAGETQVWEFRILSRDGRTRWLRSHCRPLRDGEEGNEAEGNQVVRLVGVCQDVTEWRLAEEARHKSEQDLQFAVGAARLGTWYCNWPFDKIVWNDVCHAHFFLPPGADVDFNLFYSLMHPDDREPMRRAIDWAVEERVEYNVEYRTVGPEGQTRWINAVGRASYTDSGVPTRFDGITIDITARKQVEQELSEAFQREALVNRIGQAIRQAQDPESLLQTAVEALGRALDADRCYYVTYDLEAGRGTLGPEWYGTGLDPLAGEYGIDDYGLNRDPGYLSGHTHVVEDAHALADPEARDRVGLRSLVRAPLAPGPIMTALTVAMSDKPRVWTQNEIRLVEAVASQTQVALEASRMQQREHRIATALQDALQPPVPCEIPRLDVVAFTRPALDEAKIGGDFYDVFPLDNDLYAVIVGDVSGKGLAAAAQLATVRNMLRGVLYQYRTPSPALTSLNTVVTTHDLLAGLVTLFVGLYDVRTGCIEYASCGHEPGLIQRMCGGPIELLNPTGLPLGALENACYEQGAVTLSPGDRLLLYTDGLTEAGPDRLHLLGMEGLIRFFEAQAGQPDLEASALGVVADAQAFAEGVFRDDVCVLLLQRT